MKYFHFFIISILFLFQSCIKNGINNQESDRSRMIKNQIESWLDSKKTSDSFQNYNIELLKKDISQNVVNEEILSSNKSIITVDVSATYYTYRKIDKTKNKLLLIAVLDNAKILSTNLLLIQPNNANEIEKINSQSIINILNHRNTVINGTYKVFTSDGKFILALEYEKGKLKSNKILKQKLEGNIIPTGCIDWYIVTTYHWPDGTQTQTEEFLYQTCPGNDCHNPDLQSICPGDESGGGEVILQPNENIDGVDKICESSFKFQTINSSANSGGWRAAATDGIHMNIIDTRTGEFVPIFLPRLYFGLPIIRANGEFYSETKAQELAANAVEYAEQEVMDYFHSVGGLVNWTSITLLYRQKINEKMQQYGGSATLTPGMNVNISVIGNASYGWPIIGCL